MSKCRVWVGRVAALAGDRNAEVRRAACQALHLVYTRMDGPTLLTHVAHASPADQVITSSLEHICSLTVQVLSPVCLQALLVHLPFAFCVQSRVMFFLVVPACFGNGSAPKQNPCYHQLWHR